jgi:hypothetical protein
MQPQLEKLNKQLPLPTCILRTKEQICKEEKRMGASSGDCFSVASI